MECLLATKWTLFSPLKTLPISQIPVTKNSSHVSKLSSSQRLSFLQATYSFSTASRNSAKWLLKAQHPSDKVGENEQSVETEHSVYDIHLLEEELQKAVTKEDYKKAAKLRDQLQVLQDDDRASILATNQTFYKAFERGDLSVMRKIWSKGNSVHIVHPAAGCISGFEYVMESWEVIFGPDLDLPLQIELQNVEVHSRGSLGFVTCLELVRTNGGNWGKQVATNIFEKIDGKWYICVHHASHISA